MCSRAASMLAWVASCSASVTVCIALTMMAMNRLSMVKVAIRMNGMKNTQA